LFLLSDPPTFDPQAFKGACVKAHEHGRCFTYSHCFDLFILSFPPPPLCCGLSNPRPPRYVESSFTALLESVWIRHARSFQDTRFFHLVGLNFFFFFFFSRSLVAPKGKFRSSKPVSPYQPLVVTPLCKFAPPGQSEAFSAEIPHFPS